MTHSDLSVNIAEPDSGATPLMLASIIGHMEMVKLLINQGAGTDLNTKDFVYGWTALMQATFYGHQEVTKYLLKCGADPTIQGMYSRSTFSFAHQVVSIQRSFFV